MSENKDWQFPTQEFMIPNPQTLLSETGDRQFPYSQSQPATPLGDGANHYPSFASNHVSNLRVIAQIPRQLFGSN